MWRGKKGRKVSAKKDGGLRHAGSDLQETGKLEVKCKRTEMGIRWLPGMGVEMKRLRELKKMKE